MFHVNTRTFVPYIYTHVGIWFPPKLLSYPFRKKPLNHVVRRLFENYP